MKKFKVKKVAMVSVVKRSAAIENFFNESSVPFLKLNSKSKLPIKNNYQSPQTLGMDRIGAVMGASSFFPKGNILVINAGTCITYDVLTSEGEYHGGNITPGVDMRFRALHTFTDQLPLIKKASTKKLIGASTAESILTGVIRGTMSEMQGMIGEYKKIFPRLYIIITGGDASLFESSLNCKIFARPNLVLFGLNHLLTINAHA